MLWLLLVVLLCTLIGWFFFAKPYLLLQRLRSQGIPSLAYRPVVGNLPDLIKGFAEDHANGTLFAQQQRWHAQLGTVFVFGLGPFPRLSITDPEMIKEILITKSASFGKPPEMTTIMGLVMGNGLVLSDGQYHERQRKIISPVFLVKNLKLMIPAIIKSADYATEQLNRHLDTEIEMHEVLSALTLNIIANAAFGFSLSEGEGEGATNNYASIIYKTLSFLMPEASNFILKGKFFIPNFLSLPIPENRRIFAMVEELHAVLRQIVEKRKVEIAKGNDRNDLLGALLHARDDENIGMSDEAVKDEAITFLLAGHETTSQLLSWTILLLTLHPKWENLLVEEVCALTEEELLSYETISQLKVLQMVVQESMRVLPPVPLIVRECLEDVTLGKFFVERGTCLNIPIALIQRDEGLWSNPDVFDPNRFADGVADATHHRMSYLPFSHGNRNCIGSNFAILEAKIVLVKLYRQFQFCLAPSYKHAPESVITLRPKFGLPMTVSKRQ